MFNWQSQEDRNTIRDILTDDGIVLCSTDTVYGLLARISQPAEQQLRALKGERAGKPFLVLIAGTHKLSSFAELPDVLTQFLERVWPGPLTCVVKTSDGTIALRVPAHEGLQKLLEYFDGLYSTSANVSGEGTPAARENIDPVLLASADATIFDEQPLLDKRAPSTILDCTDPDSIRVIREGAFPIAELEEIYGTAFRRN